MNEIDREKDSSVYVCVRVSMQRDHEILITPVGWRGHVSDRNDRWILSNLSPLPVFI